MLLYKKDQVIFRLLNKQVDNWTIIDVIYSEEMIIF